MVDESIMRPSPFPQTYSSDVARAMKLLGYREMVALSQMFHQWALTEEDLTPDNRTKVLLWSCDFERLADYVGPEWQPSERDHRDVLTFLGARAVAGERGSLALAERQP